MTPPRPTARTAAELREAAIQMHCDSGGCDSVRGGPPGSHDSVGCHLAGMLDALMAAVRAEALATRQSEIDELVADFQRLHAKYKVTAAPLPRAVRELLRDVVLMDRERQATLTPFSEFVPMSVSQRAARILGTTPGAIVARARKVRK